MPNPKQKTIWVISMTDKERLSVEWKRFLQKQWKMFLVIIGIIAGAVIGAIFVFLWVIDNGQATGLVPALIGQWTVGYCITFLLHLIFWEIIFVGIPLIVAAITLYMLWYRKLPKDEKFPSQGAAATGGGGGISFLIGIVWLVITWVEGRWDLAFESWTLNEWVYSWLAAFLWVLLIIGVPLAIGITWWLRREIKEEPSAPIG